MTDTSSIRTRLERNRIQRQTTEAQLDSLRDELASLLTEGRAAGLPVAHMATAAGITRETAHKLLRRESR